MLPFYVIDELIRRKRVRDQERAQPELLLPEAPPPNPTEERDDEPRRGLAVLGV